MIWQWGGTEQLSDGEVMFKKAVKVRGNEDVLGSIALEQQAVVSIRYCYLVHAYTMPVCQGTPRVEGEVRCHNRASEVAGVSNTSYQSRCPRLKHHHRAQRSRERLGSLSRRRRVHSLDGLHRRMIGRGRTLPQLQLHHPQAWAAKHNDARCVG